MIVKYKNKKYSSDDVPIFLFFRSDANKREFIDILANYEDSGVFIKLNYIDIALLGNTVVKNKRAALHVRLDSIAEKKDIQRYLFNSNEESNAVISTPPDIKPSILEGWIEKHTKDLI